MSAPIEDEYMGEIDDERVMKNNKISLSFSNNNNNVNISNKVNIIDSEINFTRVYNEKFIKGSRTEKYYKVGNTSNDRRNDCHLRYNPKMCPSQSKFNKPQYRTINTYGNKINTLKFTGTKVENYNNLFVGKYTQLYKNDESSEKENKTGKIYGLLFHDTSFTSTSNYSNKYFDRYLLYLYNNKQDAIKNKNAIEYFTLFFKHTALPMGPYTEINVINSIIFTIVLLVVYILYRILILITNQCDVTLFEIFFGRCGSSIRSY